jgi:hypothetical protein
MGKLHTAIMDKHGGCEDRQTLKLTSFYRVAQKCPRKDLSARSIRITFDHYIESNKFGCLLTANLGPGHLDTSRDLLHGGKLCDLLHGGKLCEPFHKDQQERLLTELYCRRVV